MIELKEVIKFPQVINNTHESLYRSYHILAYVRKLLMYETPTAVIMEIIDFLDNPDVKFVSRETIEKGSSMADKPIANKGRGVDYDIYGAPIVWPKVAL